MATVATDVAIIEGRVVEISHPRAPKGSEPAQVYIGPLQIAIDVHLVWRLKPPEQILDWQQALGVRGPYVTIEAAPALMEPGLFVSRKVVVLARRRAATWIAEAIDVRPETDLTGPPRRLPPPQARAGVVRRHSTEH